MTTGKWFSVNPQTIDLKIFQKKRKDVNQEKTRLLILEAFAEWEKEPLKYGMVFETLIPEKTWVTKPIYEFEAFATRLGNHIADWVEQALEWAQRIYNGESWEVICNYSDNTDWYRIIKWKNGRLILVGGSRRGFDYAAISEINYYDFGQDSSFDYAVPLVVRYK